MSTESAMRELRHCSGSQFDPAAVNALLDALAARDRLTSEPVAADLRHTSACLEVVPTSVEVSSERS
jgi:HD-GYP domain-containing protein (c-di-GMP phosphodiesterase class II)